jgi:UDP-GlcNAc:undecaprenyl-phosphate GlcNAc-1-phosphate transferase
MSTAILLGFSCFLCALLLTPICRNAALKFGLVDRPDSTRKLHPFPVPRVGGVAIACAYTVGVLLLNASPLSEALKLRIAARTAPAALFLFVAGLLDDLIGLKPWQKLLAQLASAAIAYAYGIQVHFINGHSIGWLALPITVLWLTACSNAFNLIDGLDGLAAGVGLFATVTVLVAAWLQPNIELALVTVPLAASLLGFLFYNFNPASIFLGDCGSMLIGFLLGCYGILWSQKSATLLGLTGPMIAFAVPLLDTALTILRRYLRHQPVFQADRGHIHHRLLERGFSVRRAALVMYGVSGVAALLSLLASVVHNHFAGWVLVLFCAITWIGVHQLGYVEFGAAGSLMLRGGFRRHLEAHVHLLTIEERLQGAASPEACWSVLRDGCQRFGFHSVEFQFNGRQYREEFDRKASESWTLQIPLIDDDYIQLHRHFESQAPAVVAPFASLLRTTLQVKAAEFRKAETAKEPEYAHSGGGDDWGARLR